MPHGRSEQIKKEAGIAPTSLSLLDRRCAYST
jgi:hypothetical protein